MSFFKKIDDIVLLPKLKLYSYKAENFELNSEDLKHYSDFFMGSLDFSKIKFKIVNQTIDKLLFIDAIAMTLGDTIFFSAKKAYNPKDGMSRSYLVHELLHMWQIQNLNKILTFSNNYLFDLIENKKLIEYGQEQQATIIQSYYLWKTFGDKVKHQAFYCKNFNELGYKKTMELTRILYLQLIKFQ